MSPLEQEPSKIVTDPAQYLTWIYGEPGGGKTTLGSQIDGHYFLITEPGIAGVAVYGSTINSWQDFLNVGAELIGAKTAGWVEQRVVRTIVIDTLDMLFYLCGLWVCEKEAFLDGGKSRKFDKIDDIPFGKGYKRVSQLILAKISRFRQAGFGVVLFGHIKERIIQWRGQDVTKYGPNLSPTSCTTLVGACDCVGCLSIQQKIARNDKGDITAYGEGRFIRWQPTFLVTAKHRLHNFPERMQLEIDTGWSAYEKLFNNTIQVNTANQRILEEAQKGDI